MNLEKVAQAYISCVEMEDRLRTSSPELAEELGILRADLHALWMETLKEAGIAFTDREHAARLAFELIRQPATR